MIWAVCTFLAGVSGRQYVKASGDFIGPAVLAQGAGLLLCSVTYGFDQKKQDLSKAAAAVAGAALHAWLLALGLLHLFVSTLTLASFGLSSIADTYIVRTLEPLCTSLLLYMVHGQRRTPLQLLLLGVVGAGTAAVVLRGVHPNQGTVPMRKVLQDIRGDSSVLQPDPRASGGSNIQATQMIAMWQRSGSKQGRCSVSA